MVYSKAPLTPSHRGFLTRFTDKPATRASTMAVGLILLIVVTQVAFYAAMGYMIWYFRRKLAERESLGGDLAQSFSPRCALPHRRRAWSDSDWVCGLRRRSAGLEHRIDVAAM